MLNILFILNFINIFIGIEFNKFPKKDEFDFCNNYCLKNYKNIDNNLNLEIKNFKIKAKIFDKKDLCLSDCKNHYLYNKFESSLDPKQKNYCINGKDPKKLNEKEYLYEFAKGQCSPIAFLPGLFGTRLVIEIDDCYEFIKNYPRLHEVCSLGSCTDKKPWKTYNLWLTDLFSPMSIFSINKKYSDCFANFLKVLYIFDVEKNEYKLNIKKGLKVKVAGLNEKNGKEGNCGVEATQDYAPGIDFLSRELRGYKYYTKFLLHIGYKIGLTVQHLPYDFRLSYKENDLNILFKENIERLYELNNKKVIVVTHSLGSLNGLYEIKKNENVELYKKIGNWITVAPPYFGSTKTVFNIFSLFSDFYFHGIGIKKFENKEIVETLKCVIELMPPKPSLFRYEKWFEWVQNRIDHEVYTDDESYKKKGANLLPNVNDICYYNLDDNYCKYNLNNYFLTMLKFDNNNIHKIEDMDEVVNKYTDSEKIKFLYEITKNNNDLYNENPKIQHTFIFVNSINTLESVEYTRDISDKIFSQYYNEPDYKIYRNGDGTVSAYSVLYKAYKQAYEFENEKNKGYKPIKILELCSKNNRIDKNFYDTFDKDSNQNIFTKNSYNGIECDCDHDSDKSGCEHSLIFQDSKFFNSMFNLVQLEEKVDLKKYKEYLDKLSIKQIKSYSEECVQLRFIDYISKLN